MVIFVDADGCPVVQAASQTAKKYNVPIVIVKNYAVEIEDSYAEIVTVDISSDSADYYIANRIEKNDIVVSQDYGLAAMCLAKGAFCINQNGMIIDSDNIDGILGRRHLNQKLRREQKIYTKFKKRNPHSNEDFRESLIKLIEQGL